MFPNSNGNLKNFFPDEIINHTKEIIIGLKNYVVKKEIGYIDKLFEEKINNVNWKNKKDF